MITLQKELITPLMRIIKIANMNLSKKNLREKEFHNKLHSGSKGRKENIFYKALSNLTDDFDNFIKENSNDKVVLDFGCGVGSITEQVANFKPLRLVGADISDVSIKKAREKAKEQNLNIEYRVENCENLNINSNTFDLIYGTGILHHLHLKDAITEINRLLKQNGSMLFIEPLGTNPFINLYRKFTPGSRSKDELPFVYKDFKFLKEKFGDLTIKYYGFFTLIFCFLYRSPKKNKIYKVLAFLDEILFKIKFFRFLAWSVLIIAKKN